MAKSAERAWWRDERTWLWLDTLGVVGAYAVLAARLSQAGGGLDDVSVTVTVSPPHVAEAEEPLVSIIVPARDEADNICQCVASLLGQDYPSVEVIAVDDGSRDATPELLAQLQAQHPRGDRLRIVRLDELPAGWAGKPHALQEGVQRVRGEWLLFTDADTVHAPRTVRAALAYACAHRLDLLSLNTRQELPGFWNKVLMPLAYMGIGVQYPARAVNDPASSVAIANGQFILLRRAVYDAFGGYAHPRLRATVVDDRDLAREVKTRGYRMRLANGDTLVSTHMYRGLRDHWRGWSKNVYAGSRGGPVFFGTMIVGLFSISVAPALLLAGGLAGRRAWLLPALSQWAAVVAFRRRLDREIGVPRIYGVTHPLGGAIFTAILARAAWRKLTGRGVEWRGRSYRV